MKVKLIKEAPWEVVTLNNGAIITKTRWLELEDPKYVKPIIKWVEEKKEEIALEDSKEGPSETFEARKKKNVSNRK